MVERGALSRIQRQIVAFQISRIAQKNRPFGMLCDQRRIALPGRRIWEDLPAVEILQRGVTMAGGLPEILSRKQNKESDGTYQRQGG